MFNAQLLVKDQDAVPWESLGMFTLEVLPSVGDGITVVTMLEGEGERFVVARVEHEVTISALTRNRDVDGGEHCVQVFARREGVPS